jgi:hypothetical protein
LEVPPVSLPDRRWILKRRKFKTCDMKWMTSNAFASASGFPREFFLLIFIKTSVARVT